MSNNSYKNISFKNVSVQQDRNILKLNFNRPQQLNAINGDTYEDIIVALNTAAKDDRIQCVVISGGSHRYYSSGNDLSMFMVSNFKERIPQFRNMLIRFVEAFIRFPKILIAAVNGPAVGIAVTTLGLCDVVLASAKASFTTPFMNLAQSPEACSSYTFPRLMGHTRAVEMLLMGRRFSAAEAKACGLVMQVFAEERFASEVNRVVNQFSEFAPQALQVSKGLMRRDEMEKLLEINRHEAYVLSDRWVSKECADAASAFMTKKHKSRL